MPFSEDESFFLAFFAAGEGFVSKTTGVVLKGTRVCVSHNTKVVFVCLTALLANKRAGSERRR